MGIFLLVVYVLSLLLSLFAVYKDSVDVSYGFSYWNVLTYTLVSFIPIINTLLGFIVIHSYFDFIFDPIKLVYYKIDSFMSKDVFWRKKTKELIC